MKKNLLSVIALVVAAAALIAACVCVGQLNARIGELETSNAALAEQVQILSARMEEFFIQPAVTGVSDWNLTPVAWSDGSGADVTLTMTPVEYDEGISVRFVVEMEGQPMADIPCRWGGATYTATAGLLAMNGYTYSCVFESPSGTDTQILASPDAPTAPEAVYLADSLSAYCNLLVDSWKFESGTLTITGGYAQVQLPQIGDGAQNAPEAELLLVLNGADLGRCELELAAGEGTGGYEAELTGASFEVPELGEGDLLELWLNAGIGGGTQSVCGAEWYLEEGQLLLMAG
ncbi:MAG: hypothetical protein IJ375_06135 [Oscillospiraceae bacterium]|nr:hypothetical protein [Oscillospiraceae bacterium]